ncbi:hypothetical protein BC833DRAFT_611308 [Globomyces pollinis-pini]|nr:hypothetical protein BC833DRAFT_611308 [Globomyces pollinis-pini]
MSENNTANDLAGLITNLFIQLSISSACFVGFSVLRPTNKATYEPKLKYAVERKKPQPLTNTLFGWLKAIFEIEEVETIDKIGLDAVMFLRYVSLGCRFFSYMTLCAIPLTIIHYFAPQIERIGTAPIKSTNGTLIINPSLASLSIQNVPRGSNLLYIHSALAYIFSFFAMYLMYCLWTEYIEMRKYYYTDPDFLNGIHNQTVVFTNIPDELKTEGNFKSYLQGLHLEATPKQVLLGRDYLELSELVKRHLLLTEKFEKVLIKYLKDPTNLPPKRPTHFEGGLFGVIGFLGGKKVDSIDFYRNELLKLEREIYKLRAQRDSDFKSDSSCFVGFNSIRDAHIVAKQLTHIFSRSDLYSNLKASPNVRLSPSNDDILWDNIGLAPKVKQTRKLISLALMIAVVIGWFSVQIFISQISDPVNGWFAGKSFSSSPIVIFVQSVMSPALNALLNTLLPFILRIIARLQGVNSESGIERSATYKFFVFQVYQFLVKIGYTITATFWDKFWGNVAKGIPIPPEEYEALLRNFANSFVSSGVYFLTLITTGYSFFGIEILQGYPLVYGFVKRKFFSYTPREAFRLHETPKFNYMPIYGFLMMAFLLGACYALVTPIIVPAVAISFFVAYMCMKYQLYYVYETKTETGGIWWPKVFNLTCATIGFFQVTTFGAMVVVGVQSSPTGKQGNIPNVLVFFLPFMTAAFWFYINSVVKPKGEFVDKDHNIMNESLHVDERLNSVVLKDRVFNPAVVKLLPKIWVTDRMKPFLTNIYVPEYKDVLDYVSKTDPSRLNQAKDQEKGRQQQFNSLLRHSYRNSFVDPKDKDVYSSASGLQDDLYFKPPEMEGIDDGYLNEDSITYENDGANERWPLSPNTQKQ